MKTKANRIEECATLFEIDVPAETIDGAFEEVYTEIQKIANVPGFRAGKAPKDLVRKHYDRSAREEVLKRLIPEAYRRALEEHKISPIGLPEISDVSFEAGKALSFKARVDTHPRFTLKRYTLIAIEKKKAAVHDNDVAKTLESLRELNAAYIPAPDRPVEMGDYVMADLECFVDSEPAHKKRENAWLVIEKESLIPGLNEKMTGMVKNGARDIEVVLPEQYPDKSIAGKKALYRVMVKEIKTRRLPDLDDEFAKGLGKTSLEELRKEVAAELERRMAAAAELDAENQLLKKLMDDNVFPVPSGLVKKQIRFMVEGAKARLAEKGFKAEELDKKGPEFAEKFKGDAVRQVRLMFILDEIARVEKIAAGDSDIEGAYASIAAQTNQSVDKVKEYYRREGFGDSLAEKVREEKVIRFLLDHAQIEEVN